MQINITGRHIDTGESLRTHVEDRLSEAIGKYFDSAGNVSVTFSKVGHYFRSDCAVHLDSGMYLQATGNDNNIYACFEQTLERVAKQLRRYKRKLKNHHIGDASAPIALAPPLVSEAPFERDDAQAIVIAERVAALPQMTLAAAIEILEEGLVDHLLFNRNDKQGHSMACLVRRRSDGNVGWIEVAA